MHPITTSSFLLKKFKSLTSLITLFTENSNPYDIVRIKREKFDRGKVFVENNWGTCYHTTVSIVLKNSIEFKGEHEKQRNCSTQTKSSWLKVLRRRQDISFLQTDICF